MGAHEFKKRALMINVCFFISEVQIWLPHRYTTTFHWFIAHVIRQPERFNAADWFMACSFNGNGRGSGSQIWTSPSPREVAFSLVMHQEYIPQLLVTGFVLENDEIVWLMIIATISASCFNLMLSVLKFIVNLTNKPELIGSFWRLLKTWIV